MVKPGWKTTEFWVNLGIQLLGIAVITGLYDPKVGAEVTSQLGPMVTGVVDIGKDASAFIAMAISGFGYSKSRAVAKANGSVVKE